MKVHAYVRHRLGQKWGVDKVDPEKPIPAHILGNMWAQTWENTLKSVAPYPNVTNPLDEVNDALIQQVPMEEHKCSIARVLRFS